MEFTPSGRKIGPVRERLSGVVVSMMDAEYRDIQLRTLPDALEVRVVIENKSGQTWKPENFSLGWQFFDPETNLFILEGAWAPVPHEIPPGQTRIVRDWDSISTGDRRISDLRFTHPAAAKAGPIAAASRFCGSLREASGGQVVVLDHEIATERKLRLAQDPQCAAEVFRGSGAGHSREPPPDSLHGRRDILARYRGSFGDVFWTVLNPLLLMATYFFVFGVVLHSRFGSDKSSTGFALYFLAGMLPWLAFSEPAGRAPHVILEHRNFVKKLIFPLETLPVNQVVSGLVTEMFAAAVFMAALLVIRGSIPSRCCGCRCCSFRNCCSRSESAGSWRRWAFMCATSARSWAFC